MKRTQLSKEEKSYIEANLPATIIRRGYERKLGYCKNDNEYNIWYGTVISGNFITETTSLKLAVVQMKEYIEKYKDMDEYTLSNLGIKKGICLHCKVPLVKENKNEYFCPKCRICYDKMGIINRIALKLYRWLLKGG